METLIATNERRLKAAGKRVTPQRRMVLRILAEAQGHLDANEIYARGKRQDARLSLSTVYRTLGVLKGAEVVRELHLDADHHRYELDEKDEHSHLVCLGCGRVIEVDTAAFSEAVMAVGKAHGFAIASAQVELTGYCSDCQPRDNGGG